MNPRLWMASPFLFVALIGAACSQDSAHPAERAAKGRVSSGAGRVVRTKAGAVKLLNWPTTTISPVTISISAFGNREAWRFGFTYGGQPYAYDALIDAGSRVSFSIDGCLTIHEGGVLVSDAVGVRKIVPRRWTWLRARQVIAGVDQCTMAMKYIPEGIFSVSRIKTYYVAGNAPVWVNDYNNANFILNATTQQLLVEGDGNPGKVNNSPSDQTWVDEMKTAAAEIGMIIG